MQETRGLILYNRNFREDDKLVKIFTEAAGKRMFFVKHASRSKLASVIQPLVIADFIVKVNDEGLSYIEDYGQVRTFHGIQSDIFSLAYATYLLSLADAAITDGTYDPHLFAFLVKTLDLMEQGLDYEVLTNIFEIQILERFGVSLNFHDCLVCHQVGQAFDFSFTYAGLLCPQHYDRDPRRSHLNPNVPYLLNKFQHMQFSELKQIRLQPGIKKELRDFIDQIYEEYVGIHLKSKKFIDDLQGWGHMMQKNS